MKFELVHPEQRKPQTIQIKDTSSFGRKI